LARSGNYKKKAFVGEADGLIAEWQSSVLCEWGSILTNRFLSYQFKQHPRISFKDTTEALQIFFQALKVGFSQHNYNSESFHLQS
jgi:hypothetical protein